MAVGATNQDLLNRLDRTLDSVSVLQSKKLVRIDVLKKNVLMAESANVKMQCLEALYEEYHVFQFDSAMVYVNKLIAEADAAGNLHYQNLGRIDKAELLAMGSLYPEALAVLQEIDRKSMDMTDAELWFKYYFTHFKVYQYWSNYCDDGFYKPRYEDMAKAHLQKAVAWLRPSSEDYDYFMGEYCVFIKHDDKRALQHYFRTLKNTTEDRRVYAMACFAIANNYSAHGDWEKYEEYITKASISDLKSSTRETLALQELAMFLYKKGDDNISRAERYINYAMDDAKAYHNRLRIMEVSKKLPVIVSSYHDTLLGQNKVLRIASASVLLLMLVVLVLMYFFLRQNKKLVASEKELSHNNGLLSNLNDKLMVLNDKLVNTNTHREQLAKLYIDLCAQYIDKLSKFEILVQRKIKANQIKDLLNMVSSTRLPEEDAATFLHRFDRAFLNLYPSFVREFNTLLLDEEQVEQKHADMLTTELRMYALMRLGVTESSEIAALLFYTPRTIYNYRSAFKNKAKNRDTFEDEVMKLCTVIHDDE